MPGHSYKVEIARGVDDLLAITFLLDYFRRSGYANVPPLEEVHQRLSSPTVATIATAVATAIRDPFVSAVLGQQGFADTLPVPSRVIADNWQRRLGDATWMLYGDGRIPL